MEIIAQNQCGICVAPNNPQEVATAVQKLLADPELALRFGQNGRKAIIEKYNWDAEAKKLQDVYEKL